MLETLRKHHYVFMCIVAVVVIVAFTFLYDPNREARPGSGPLISMSGEKYDATELTQINSQSGMIRQLMGLADRADMMALYSDPVIKYAQSMSGVVRRYQSVSRRENELDIDFIMNVIILRQQAEKMGVSVGREDLEKFVQTIAPFQTAGQFNGERYEAFLNSGVLGDRAATERRLYTMLRDVMIYQKLDQLIGGAYPPSKAEVDFIYAQQHEKVTAASAVVDKAKHKGAAPTDEEIQKYYDAEKAKFEKPAPAVILPGKPEEKADPILLTGEKRAVKYAFITLPVRPSAPVAPTMADTSKLTPEEKKAKEDEFKTLQDAHLKALAEHGTKIAEVEAQTKEERKKAERVSNALNDEARGVKTFEDIVKAEGMEPLIAPVFSKDQLPEPLKGEPAVAEEIFAGDSEVNTSHTMSASNGYAFYEVTEIVPPSVRPLAEIKDLIVTKLQAQKDTEALRAAADTARSSIVEAVKGGKTFKEAAEAAGLTETEIPTFSQAKPPVGLANAQVITAQTQTLNPGDVSQPVEVPEGLALVYLAKKELPQDPKMKDDKEALRAERTLGGNSGFMPQPSPVFVAWFTARRNEAQEVRLDNQ